MVEFYLANHLTEFCYLKKHLFICFLNFVYVPFLEMSSDISTKSALSKAELQVSVVANDVSISFTKPTNVQSECWRNYS
jgi:hypothetical protein